MVATLGFTPGVDKASLREHLTLSMRPSEATVSQTPDEYPFELALGKSGREAYIKTEPLELPPRDNFMELALASGVEAELGPSTTDTSIEETVRIPSVSTFFRVDETRTRIVRNEENDPEQTLVMAFTDGVKTKVVTNNIRAWVLPDHRYWRRDDIDAALKQRAERLELEGNPTEHAYSKLQSFRFDAPEGRQLLVELPSGLTSQGGFDMTVPHTKLLRAPQYPEEANVVGDGSLLALSGERKLTLQARGLPGLRVELFRLLDEQVNHLVSQTRGDLAEADFRNYSFDEDNLAERHQEVISLASAHPSEATYASVDLAPYLSDAGRGIFVARVQGWHPGKDRPVHGVDDRRLILVSDLSVIAKREADDAHEVFVHSLGDQAPVTDARVSLLGRNGQPVLQRTTDASGHASFPDASDFDDEKEATVWLVEKGGDLAFLPYSRNDRQLNFSRFDTGGVRTSGRDADEKLRASVFSDRGIYRPGESGHAGIMVKRTDWQSVEGVPVAISLKNPKGNQVLSERRALPADGFIEQALSFDRTDPTGDYRLNIHLLDEDHDRRRRLLGHTTVSVEAFQPDTMRIHTRFAGDAVKGWRTSLEQQGRVELENLFGVPAQKRRVEAEYTLSPARFRFEQYQGFVFEDPFRNREDRLDRSVSRQLEEATSDDKGRASFDLDLSEYGSGLFRLAFKAQGYEPDGGRSVSARSSVRLSPAKRLVGWKADGNLDYLKRDSDHRIRFVAVTPDLEATAVKDLTLRVAENRKISTLVRQDDGTLAYQTVTKEEVVSDNDFTIGADGSDWAVPTGEPGDYIARLRDEAGKLLAEVEYSVAGSRNLTGASDKETQLDIELEQHDYQPGEQIEMQIKAPYTGAGLITIERDDVMAHKWFRTDTTRSVQTIRVPEELEGNGYVNVTFVRSLDSSEVFTQPLSHAVAPFQVDRAARTVDIGLEAPAKVKPGSDLTIDYRTDRDARLALFAVDEGILQVADYETPDPLDSFLRKRALEVSTFQMADLLLPEFRLLKETSAVGGGEQNAKAALGANLNPFQRGLKEPVAFWSGLVDASDEQQSLSFQVPDSFDGRLRLMAVASAPEAAGSAQDDVVVRGPFVLQPNAITTAAPGDEFRVSVGVTNALPEATGESNVQVSLETNEHLTIIGEAERGMTLGAGREDRASFRVRAADKPGNAELVFRATTDGHEMTRTATLSVRPAVPHRTTLNAGISDSEGETRLARTLRPELAEQNATLGHSPLILVGGLHQFLANYPHGCSEQLISRVFPVLGLTNDSVLDLERDRVMNFYRRAVDALRARQQANGGFGFWPGSSRVDRFTSIYAMHFLLDAEEEGVPVPEKMRQTGLDYLRQIATREPQGGRHAYEQAYAIYLLTRDGRVTTNYLTRLQETMRDEADDDWRSSLTAAYMAAAYRLLKVSDQAEQLIEDHTFARPGSDFERDMDSALARNAQYVYLLSRHFPQRLEELSEERIHKLIKPISEQQFNTLSASYTVLALGSWGQEAAEAAEGSQRIQGETDGETQTLAEESPPVARSDVPVSVSRLLFSGDGRLFHTAVQSGYDRDLPDEAVKQGLEITRAFLNEDGETVTEVEQGAELTVRLRMRALDNRQHDNIAVVDLLPGGFQVERDSVRREAGWSTDYVDIREDRLVLYGSLDSDVRTFEYQVKATGTGTFKVPPAFAESMYHPDLQGRSAAGEFRVHKP
ncbi:alpha-2-macroglobulin family protein [Halomonadaceae bacterium KBTZ08]